MLYWWCVNCWFTISSKKMKHEKWQNCKLSLNTDINLPPELMICEVWVINNFSYVQQEKRFTNGCNEQVADLKTRLKQSLPAVSMIWVIDSKFHQYILKREKLRIFKCHQLKGNTEITSPPILMTCEVWVIHIFRHYSMRSDC